ncbi:MAG: GtrA family protein [Nocardioides sp.]|uniref:GtrA family protein n=1 Tax=Nocardioides sp. TaxID=35761 RepID=UPI002616E035|nr:GtrA family protein [Nocardioides sp.]MCW2835150.1 GtrA family protein [Nocardioides sp.]
MPASRLVARHQHNVVLLARFGSVGVSGVLVNLVTLIVVKRLGPGFDGAVFGLPLSELNLRWYHVYSTIAFFVANLCNFQLNRSWTFRSAGHARWWKEYWPFLAVGLAGQVIGLTLLTALLHPDSALSLPTSVLDDTSGLRTRLYWGQLVVIAVVMPLSFVINKLWTFAAVRTHHVELVDPINVQLLVEDDEA